jgi:hypothetical protein
MGDCSDISGDRLDGGHEPSGRTTVRLDFPRISLKIFFV